jgi:leucyl-tRNA synthetase
MMELVNQLYAEEANVSGAAMGETLRILTFLLAPFAPYLAQELWDEQGNSGPVFKQAWPGYDPDLARETEVEIPVQINGKLRARVIVPAGLDSAQLSAAVLDDEKVQVLIEGKTVVKVIAVPGKLVNLVVK